VLRQTEVKGSQHKSRTYFGFFGGGAVDLNFSSLFHRGSKLLFLIDALLLLRRSPKDITKHQAFVRTIFKVY